MSQTCGSGWFTTGRLCSTVPVIQLLSNCTERFVQHMGPHKGCSLRELSHTPYCVEFSSSRAPKVRLSRGSRHLAGPMEHMPGATCDASSCHVPGFSHLHPGASTELLRQLSEVGHPPQTPPSHSIQIVKHLQIHQSSLI